MQELLLIVELICILYFGYISFYNFLFSAAGNLSGKSVTKTSSGSGSRYAVLIPAYKEDGVIFDVARDALNQNFPNEYYDVVIIADSLQKSTLNRLSSLSIKVVEVNFEKSTKVKALNEAMRQLPDQYDYAVILDADNLMDKDFLAKADHLHAQGHKALQGRRAAKNENSTLAFLDGLSEEINNHIICRGSTGLGLSSALKGSGMSFHYTTFKSLLGQMESVGGFDRELELRLVDIGIKVKYVADLVVYDEKVERQSAFENQRKRWISSQFFYFRKYFKKGIASFFKGNMSLFNSSVLRNIHLPRLINLGLQTILTALFVVIHSPLMILWVGFYGLQVIATFTAIPRAYYTKKLLVSIFSLPLIFFKMFLLLFKLKGANKKFIHTPHGTQ